MARLARIVVPNVPHHTQRGKPQATVFFWAEDYAAYRDLLAEAAREMNFRCPTACRM